MKAEYIEKPFSSFKIVVETPADLSLLENILSNAEMHESRYCLGSGQTSMFTEIRKLRALIKNPT